MISDEKKQEYQEFECVLRELRGIDIDHLKWREKSRRRTLYLYYQSLAFVIIPTIFLLHGVIFRKNYFALIQIFPMAILIWTMFKIKHLKNDTDASIERIKNSIERRNQLLEDIKRVRKEN